MITQSDRDNYFIQRKNKVFFSVIDKIWSPSKQKQHDPFEIRLSIPINYHNWILNERTSFEQMKVNKVL